MADSFWDTLAKTRIHDVVVVETDGWDALYVDGTLKAQGNFPLLSYLEELRAPMVFTYRSYRPEDIEYLDYNMEFPEDYRELIGDND